MIIANDSYPIDESISDTIIIIPLWILGIPLLDLRLPMYCVPYNPIESSTNRGLAATAPMEYHP